jgi:acyl carrier protein
MFKLTETIADALEVNADTIDMNTTAELVESWDSLGQLSLVSALAEVTDGASDKIDLSNASSVSDIAAALKSQGIEFEI